MFKIFRRDYRKRRQLQGLTFAFTILDKFESLGLIYWQPKEKILLIEETLANLKLTEGALGFNRFLQQISLWQNYKLFIEKYESQRIKIETDAVREAKKKYVSLSRADIERIRFAARDNMQEQNIEDFGCIKEFDIYIVRANVQTLSGATEQNGQLLAVGHFDEKGVEMVAYDEIKANLKKQ